MNYLWLATIGKTVGTFFSETSSGFASSQRSEGVFQTCSCLGLAVRGVQVVLAHRLHLAAQLQLLQEGDHLALLASRVVSHSMLEGGRARRGPTIAPAHVQVVARSSSLALSRRGDW